MHMWVWDSKGECVDNKGGCVDRKGGCVDNKGECGNGTTRVGALKALCGQQGRVYRKLLKYYYC